MLVNILNKGRIPWIDLEGPLFGYEIGSGVYQILVRDSRVMIELTTPEEAKKRKAEFYKPADSVTFKDSITIKDENLKESLVEEPEIDPSEVYTEDELESLDSELDSILAEEKVKKEPEIIKTETKKYSRDELLKMTKSEMKNILKSRGYLEGPNAGKYHDTVEKLIEKVLRTQ